MSRPTSSTTATETTASSRATLTANAAGTTQHNEVQPLGSDATTKLAEAIDEFLGDLEKRFKGISDEILTRLDDMAERCDRLEQEMLFRDASTNDVVEKGRGERS